MTALLQRIVRDRAANRCEYCGIQAEALQATLHIEHVIPRKHGGPTDADNLALACRHCNLHKGPNLTGFDPDSATLCELFHPRKQVWTEHFQFDGFRITGITPCGRTTVWVLNLNATDQLLQRALAAQLYPPPSS